MFVTTSFISALLHDTGPLIHALHAFMYVYIPRTLPASNKHIFCAMGISVAVKLCMYSSVSACVRNIVVCCPYTMDSSRLYSSRLN